MNEHSIQGGPKRGTHTFVSIRQMLTRLTDVHNSFTGGIVSKFSILAY